MSLWKKRRPNESNVNVRKLFKNVERRNSTSNKFLDLFVADILLQLNINICTEIYKTILLSKTVCGKKKSFYKLQFPLLISYISNFVLQVHILRLVTTRYKFLYSAPWVYFKTTTLYISIYSIKSK